MSQRDSSEAEGESSEPVPNGTSPAKTMAPTAPTAPTPPPYSNGHPATRQSPMIDPNVMMMTNAAATIAAVAASAVQQIQKSASNNNSMSGSPSSSQSNLAAALKARKPAPGTSHLAALLGASTSQPPSVPFQAPLQPYLAFGDNVQSSNGSAVSSNAMTNALLPSMQNWSLEQLGKQ